QQYAGLADGIASHIRSNAVLYANHNFQAMKKQARPVLKRHGIKDIFSEVAMEAAVDYLLLKDQSIVQRVEGLWGKFDWEAAIKYAPSFSREPDRAKRNILYVQQRLSFLGIEHAGRWLEFVAERITGAGLAAEAYGGAVKELTDVLAREGLYRNVIREAQVLLQKEFNFS
ncbi:MAG TPA: hypothetical protein VI934_00260, partial [Candidatus Nanoarchaeia archaeon]|nr:hypothetical protein [Candidatus Nanoarchaeia archaeon]